MPDLSLPIILAYVHIIKVQMQLLDPSVKSCTHLTYFGETINFCSSTPMIAQHTHTHSHTHTHTHTQHTQTLSYTQTGTSVCSERHPSRGSHARHAEPREGHLQPIASAVPSPRLAVVLGQYGRAGAPKVKCPEDGWDFLDQSLPAANCKCSA